MALKPYKTLIRDAQDEFIINKSRFIGHGRPCATEEEALAFLAEMRAKYKDATHNCYAYIIGANLGVMRYSDDGEPGGTAGMPIIEVMKARGVTNCAVVVTRYFGGVLLGAGGLVRAYQGLVKLGLETLPVREKEASSLMTIEVEHRHFNIALRALEQSRARILDKTFASNVQIKIEIPKATEEALIANLTEKTAGGLIVTRHEN